LICGGRILKTNYFSQLFFMAKGFTVKAKLPTSSDGNSDEFNLEAAKEMIRGKSIVFCLPG